MNKNCTKIDSVEIFLNCRKFQNIYYEKKLKKKKNLPENSLKDLRC